MLVKVPFSMVKSISAFSNFASNTAFAPFRSIHDFTNCSSLFLYKTKLINIPYFFYCIFFFRMVSQSDCFVYIPSIDREPAVVIPTFFSENPKSCSFVNYTMKPDLKLSKAFRTSCDFSENIFGASQGAKQLDF